MLSIDDADRAKLPSSMRAPRGMGALLDFARHSLVAWTIRRNPRADDRSDAGDSSGECDRYDAQRSARLRELEAAGKCLARSGKDGNFRYWPADRGSRVLIEHRRERSPRAGLHR